jgi:hypothetical protein
MCLWCCRPSLDCAVVCINWFALLSIIPRHKNVRLLRPASHSLSLFHPHLGTRYSRAKNSEFLNLRYNTTRDVLVVVVGPWRKFENERVVGELEGRVPLAALWLESLL